MDGHVRVSGAGYEIIEINGKKYRLVTMSLGAMVAIKARGRLSIQSDFIAIAARAAAQSPPDMRDSILEKGFEKAKSLRSLGEDDMEAFLNTEEGMAVTLFHLVEREDGSKLESEKAAFDLLAKIVANKKLKEVEAKLRLSQGIELGNSSGPRRKPKRAQDSADGQASTPTSRENAVGQ
jgi:hypothetical protein